MASTPCSECDEEIEVAGRVRLGQKVVCNHCGAALEVVATEPLELEIAQDEDEELWEEDELEDEELAAPLDADADDPEEDEDDDLEELEELDDFDDDLEDDELDDDFDDDDFDDDFDDFDDDDYEDDLDDDDDDRWS